MQIEPKRTIIEPNSVGKFTVTFTPKVAADYTFRLISEITSLDPTLEEMNIPIRGKSEVAQFYFEMQDTDYMNRRPGNRKCPSEDISNPKVVEFDAIGVGVNYEA